VLSDAQPRAGGDWRTVNRLRQSPPAWAGHQKALVVLETVNNDLSGLFGGRPLSRFDLKFGVSVVLSPF